jgi:hypothetical protein
MRTDSAAHRGGRVARALAAIIAAAALVSVASPADAATTTRWSDWSFAGTSGAYTGTVAIAATPALTASYTSDSRSGQVGVVSGASAWLSQGTPVGAKYGTSRDRPYLNLRPRADTPTGSSTTTYSFNAPTPTSGWTFVLGDIDADQVRIRAIGPNGAELPAAALGFQGGFNYCAPGVVGKPSCVGDATDVPTWDPATRTLTGNAAAVDTSGASAWFEPSQPISSLSFIFTRRSGLPVYQTWFASLARDITGTVTDQDTAAPAAGVAVRLLDASGAVIATATTSASGAYAFTGVTATTGYTVEMLPPAGSLAVGPSRVPADLTTADAVVPFVVRDIVPVAVSGTVRDADGAPLGGVTVTLTDGPQTVTTVSASDGTYGFDQVPVGTWTPTATGPDGYSLTDAPDPIVVPANSETPITGQDFTFTADPTLSGRVATGGTGVAGVTVTASDGTDTLTTVTAADGTYSFPRIPAGSYDVSITVPDGYTSDDPDKTIALTADDTVDFTLDPARTGVIAGTVTDTDGNPVAGVEVTITGPGGTRDLVTGETGDYSLDGLDPGDYSITITVPNGYDASGPLTRTVTITAAGETVDASFQLALGSVEPPPPPPTDDPSTPPTAALSATGGTDAGATPFVGAGLIGIGATVLLLSHTSRRRTTRAPH